MFDHPTTLARIRAAFAAAGFVQRDHSDPVPEPVTPVHPIHRLITSLKTHYPDGVLPASARMRWRQFQKSQATDLDAIFDAADHFLEWVEAEERRVASFGLTKEEACDGLDVRSRQLRWRGKEQKLQPHIHRLLEFMWGRNSAETDDLIQSVWGTDVENSCVSSALHRANRALNQVGMPWFLVQNTGRICKEFFPTTRQLQVTNAVTGRRPVSLIMPE